MEKFDCVLFAVSTFLLPCQTAGSLSAHVVFFFHSYLNKYCFATRKHNVTSNLPRVSLKMKMKYAILWRLLPLIVPESATSECTIIRPGHPNGSEPLSLAVLRSVH